VAPVGAAVPVIQRSDGTIGTNAAALVNATEVPQDILLTASEHAETTAVRLAEHQAAASRLNQGSVLIDPLESKTLPQEDDVDMDGNVHVPQFPPVRNEAEWAIWDTEEQAREREECLANGTIYQLKTIDVRRAAFLALQYPDGHPPAEGLPDSNPDGLLNPCAPFDPRGAGSRALIREQNLSFGSSTTPRQGPSGGTLLVTSEEAKRMGIHDQEEMTLKVIPIAVGSVKATVAEQTDRDVLH